MKTLLIAIKNMKLSTNKRIVHITGETTTADFYGKKVEGDLSILQLAKIWSTDREAVSETENDFGSEEYEDKCNETRELIKNFPDIKLWNKEVEFNYVKINKSEIYAEDLVGWNNEGIILKISKEIKNYLFDNKQNNLLFYMTPTTIKLISKIEND